ncbi:MAG: HDOD domain-containing protein [Candidatus Dadabacteria bacterium]|nr:MAG: HDOD domain-containing protein [Candidatus Dadabacteria bacterium]
MTENRPQEFEGRLSKGKDWREIVAWVGDLPPMPNVASRAISMVENPDTTAQELSDLLSSDTALAARVLKIANSAMFARQREITTLNQAIMLIGFKALKGIIVAATLRQMNKRFGDLERLIWENSMSTAMAATIIAKMLKKRYTEEIFLLGLLHSLGQIVLLVQKDTAKEYKNVLNMIRDQNLDYASAEQEIFGFAHPLIGALVAKKWNFSAETCQTILHYRDPIESFPETELEEKTAIVQLADMVSHAAGIGSPEGYPADMNEIIEIAKKIGFDPKGAEDQLEEIVNETKERFEKEQHIYS